MKIEHIPCRSLLWSWSRICAWRGLHCHRRRSSQTRDSTTPSYLPLLTQNKEIYIGAIGFPATCHAGTSGSPSYLSCRYSRESQPTAMQDSRESQVLQGVPAACFAGTPGSPSHLLSGYSRESQLLASDHTFAHNKGRLAKESRNPSYLPLITLFYRM